MAAVVAGLVASISIIWLPAPLMVIALALGLLCVTIMVLRPDIGVYVLVFIVYIKPLIGCCQCTRRAINFEAAHSAAVYDRDCPRVL